MLFLSELIGKPVADSAGRRLGKLKDVLATHQGEQGHPKIAAIELMLEGNPVFIPYSDVAALAPLGIPLKKRRDQIVPYQPAAADLYLVRDVLDKQIIDTNGVRVVRVNDLELSPLNGGLYVANVDISGTGLLRRLGMSSLANRLQERVLPGRPHNLISWDDIELLAGDQPMRLRVPGSKIRELHPADLAEILSDLTRQEGTRLLETLDLKTLADTLEEVEPDFQISLIQSMPDERLADVLEEMSPDEAADLLAELPEDRSHELLRLMQDEEAQDVLQLLNYPEDSAGGIMTTELFTVSPDITAEGVMQLLRESASEAETVFYIYVTDIQNRLEGVFSLRELVLADPQTPVRDFMQDRLVSVDPRGTQEDCAQVIAKYNLLAVPVVDDGERLLGIVTADDALDKIIPTAWKKRLPRLYH